MRGAGPGLDRMTEPPHFQTRGWLATQSAALRTALIERGQQMTVQRGSQIYAEGDGPGGIYGILSGGIGIELTAHRLLPIIAHIHRAGVWFGHGPVLGGRKRTMGFIAMEPSELLHVPLGALREIGAADPNLFVALGALANEGMNLACRAARELLIPDAERRIAAVLIRVTAVDDDSPPTAAGGFPLSQQLLGEMSNASRHTIMRTLQTFAKRGWISTNYRHVQIVDALALSEFAWNDD